MREIHPPDNYVHMINSGGDFSVNDLINDRRDDYLREVHEIMQEEEADLPEKEQYIYASCKWCFEKIRQGGGLGIYCHPYWVYDNMYNRFCFPSRLYLQPEAPLMPMSL